MAPADEPGSWQALPAFARAAQVARCLWSVTLLQLVLLLLLAVGGRTILAQPERAPALAALMHLGVAAALGAALVLSLTGTLCCLLLATGRRRSLAALRPPLRPAPSPGAARRWRPLRAGSHGARRSALSPASRRAGWPQGVLILAGSASALGLAAAWPVLPGTAAPLAPGLAGLILVPAFLLLVAERIVAQDPALPEAGPLGALLRLPVFILVAGAVLLGAAGFGLAAPEWCWRLLALPPAVVAVELALRTLGIWFQPLPPPARARAAIGSLAAGVLMPGSLRPAVLAERLRQQLGIDIGRSWALRFAQFAAPPVLLGLLLLSWGLSGVVRIGLDQRGSYERFGAPVAMLGPGLHLILPWPFGRVRPVEYGVVHTVAVGAELTGAAVPVDTATADGPAPASANRLWDQQPGSDTPYLIASRSFGHEGFQVISADLRVLYRVGLDDAQARRALYGTVDAEALVRALSARLLARFFADRTLDQVLGARREQVADGLRARLQTELDARHSGLEVVALIVDSLHPPGGAATAYRSVQAAEINASTRRAQEEGRAHGTISVAQRDAHAARDDAEALAADVTQSALAEEIQADADSLAYRDGGRAFLLERYFSTLRTALGRGALEIVDHRLPAQQAPVIDLRGVAPDARSPAP